MSLGYLRILRVSINLIDAAHDVVVLGAADVALLIGGDAQTVALGFCDSFGVASGHKFLGQGLSAPLVLDFLGHGE